MKKKDNIVVFFETVWMKKKETKLWKNMDQINIYSKDFKIDFSKSEMN